MLAILWGAGANGKSTFIGTILAMLGDDYAVKAGRDLFLVRKQDNHPTQMARLFGKRVVACVETQDNGRLDEALVKELTGGDAIAARRMREDVWQFLPTHKALLVTNHRPEIRGTDHAIWRRIRLIPFAVVIPDDRQDKELAEKLKVELSGILAWAVRGCLEWQRYGLRCPDAVKAATASYRDEQDILGGFLADCCLVHQDAKARAGELYASYVAWCKRTGETEVPQRAFGLALRERGFRDSRGSGGTRFWTGIGTRSDTSDASDAE
jgi:putative DNA primase/helicase